jgi:hypothetical protein
VSLLDLDQYVFRDRHKRTAMLLLEGDLHYRGEFLVIATPNYLPEIAESLEPVSLSLLHRVDRYHQVAFDELNWVGFQFKNLTPLHLLCIEHNRAAENLASILRRHLLHATVLYTATRSVRKGRAFLCDYASSEQTASLTLTTDPIPEDKSDTLVRFALWPYTSAKTDRLTILQSVVARELQRLDSRQNYRAFVEQLRHILREARWNHRVYISGEIDKHFEQIQKATDYVSGVAEDISAAIDSMTKALTETLLATIGVVIASLIAALVREEMSESLFRLGMRVYAVYVVLQMIYRMGGVLYSHWVLNANAKGRLQTYEDVLGREKMADVLSPVNRRNLQFYVWFGVTFVLFICLAVATWTLGGGFGSHLVQRSASSPVVTPTMPAATLSP